MPISAADQDFVEQVQQTIIQHIQDPGLGITRICTLLNVSRTHLHNKLKQSTGRSASLFIRSVRLEHACELLQRPSLKIIDISRRVGFKDPNYFTRVFVSEFGISPSAFRKQIL